VCRSQTPIAVLKFPAAKWGPTEAKPSVYVAPRAPNANHLTRVSITAMTKLGKGLDSTCCGRTSCTSHPYRYRSGKLETGNSREPYLHTRLCWQLAKLCVGYAFLHKKPWAWRRDFRDVLTNTTLFSRIGGESDSGYLFCLSFWPSSSRNSMRILTQLRFNL
jgi:hypothetical protein